MERGFSLFELTVVLAVIGVLSSLAAPSLVSYWHAASLQAGARELASAINLGRQLAISRKTPVCVDVAATGIRLRVGGCSGNSWTGALTDASGLIRISDPATLEVSSNARVTFTPLGAAAPSATYTVTHVRTQASRAVVVAGSGRISVE
jgi:type II secretion system protein H